MRVVLSSAAISQEFWNHILREWLLYKCVCYGASRIEGSGLGTSGSKFRVQGSGFKLRSLPEPESPYILP